MKLYHFHQGGIAENVNRNPAQSHMCTHAVSTLLPPAPMCVLISCAPQLQTAPHNTSQAAVAGRTTCHTPISMHWAQTH